MQGELGRVIVTGASGFVGRELASLVGRGAQHLALRDEGWRDRIGATDWRGALVFHLAARVPSRSDPPCAFQRDNVEKTRAIAEAASRGARRLVFLSSVKVNGEETEGRPFRIDDAPAPADGYARSKWEAEQALAQVAKDTGLEVVVVRSPPVVGPGAGGNLRALVKLAQLPLPLPFAAIDNRRTLVARGDLARLLVRCATAPAVAGRTFFAGDPRPISTPRLVAVLRAAWRRDPGLFAVPRRWLEGVAAALGQGARVRRLTRSLEVDVSETGAVLGWSCTTPIEQALAEMARDFARRRDG